MRALLKPLLLPLLRRNPEEVDKQAKHFRIADESQKLLVGRLGQAFLGGYNEMLSSRSLEQVAANGLAVESHYRPFYFEGAAMGYLPKCYISSRHNPARMESDLLRMDPRFRYLYYVGIGFWYGFRHRKQPAALQALVSQLDPAYFPLCYDGFGFKLGFFEYPQDSSVVKRLERCPEEHRPFIHQGFGRALHFVYMDDAPAFEALRKRLPGRYADDLEIGRALAYGFTRVDRPGDLIAFLAAAGDERLLGDRLTGLSWALTARRLNEPEYFDVCLAAAPEAERNLLTRLPDLCDQALEGAAGYADWQRRTGAAALRVYTGKC